MDLSQAYFACRKYIFHIWSRVEAPQKFLKTDFNVKFPRETRHCFLRDNLMAKIYKNQLTTKDMPDIS